MENIVEKILLQEWASAHEPKELLIFTKGYWDQIIFVRDHVATPLATTYKEYQVIRANIKVISTHTSKSVLLPVFQVELPDGTVFTMRCNFYDWKVSVHSPRDAEVDFMGLFDPSAQVDGTYCEGFPKELVYGSYVKNKHRFTMALPSGTHHLFTFFWIFAHQVLGNRNKGWVGR